MEEMTDFQRFIKVNKLKQTQVAEYLGTSPQYVNQVANGKCALSDDKYELLAKSSWDTSMLTFPSYIKVPASVMSPYTPDDTAAIRSQRSIIEDAEIIGEHSTMQRCGDTRAVSIEECNELCPAKLPYVKGEIVQSRDVDIRQLIESEPQKLEYRTMRQMIGNPNYVQKVITAAMMPLFQPGDMLFVQFLPDDAKIISGAIYLVDTRVYGAMVRQVYLEDDDVYTLHSLNPDFKELHLRRDEIYSISLVVRSLRSDFNMPKAAPDTTEAYKRRDEQIEQLLSMHRDAMTEIRTQNERMAEERRRQDAERAAERIRHDKLIERILNRK